MGESDSDKKDRLRAKLGDKYGRGIPASAYLLHLAMHPDKVDATPFGNRAIFKRLVVKAQNGEVLHDIPIDFVLNGPIDMPQEVYIPANKGQYLGECNRRACKAINAIWHNRITKGFYCFDCASQINRYAKLDGIEPLLKEITQKPESE